MVQAVAHTNHISSGCSIAHSNHIFSVQENIVNYIEIG